MNEGTSRKNVAPLMGKTTRTRKSSFLGHKLERNLSAAVLASAIMTGSAFAADLTVNDPLDPWVITNETQTFHNVTLENNSAINGVGTAGIDADGTYILKSGTVSNVNLGGSAGLTKTTGGSVYLTGSNTYTGATVISAGYLFLGDGTSGSMDGASAITVNNNGKFAINLAEGGVLSNSIVNDNHMGAVGANTNTISGNISV